MAKQKKGAKNFTPPTSEIDPAQLRVEFRRIEINVLTQRQIKSVAAEFDMPIPTAYGRLIQIGLKHREELNNEQ